MSSHRRSCHSGRPASRDTPAPATIISRRSRTAALSSLTCASANMLFTTHPGRASTAIGIVLDSTKTDVVVAVTQHSYCCGEWISTIHHFAKQPSCARIAKCIGFYQCGMQTIQMWPTCSSGQFFRRQFLSRLRCYERLSPNDADSNLPTPRHRRRIFRPAVEHETPQGDFRLRRRPGHEHLPLRAEGRSLPPRALASALPAQRMARAAAADPRGAAPSDRFRLWLSSRRRSLLQRREPVRILIRKAQRFYDAGVRTFAVLFDDIPSRLVHEIDRKRFKNSLAAAEGTWLRRNYRISTRRLDRRRMVDLSVLLHAGPSACAHLRQVRAAISGNPRSISAARNRMPLDGASRGFENHHVRSCARNRESSPASADPLGQLPSQRSFDER